jgi:hypothetical protein
LRRTCVAAILAGLAACSSFGEGSDEDGSSPDGGTSEAGANDASADGGNDGDAGVCPKNALLCETFDEGLGKWRDVVPAFHIEPVQGNNVLMLSVAERGAGPRDISISRDLPGMLAGVRLSFRFRVANPGFSGQGDTANYAVVRIENGGAGSKVFSAIYLSNGGARANTQLTVDTTTFQGTGIGSMTYGEWHRGVIELRLGSAPTIGYHIDQDDTQTLSIKADPALELAVALGVYRPNADTPPISIDFDDVLAEPL